MNGFSTVGCYVVINLLWNIKPFPSYRRTLTPVQQTTYENIVAKGEIAQFLMFSYVKKLTQKQQASDKTMLRKTAQ